MNQHHVGHLQLKTGDDQNRKSKTASSLQEVEAAMSVRYNSQRPPLHRFSNDTALDNNLSFRNRPTIDCEKRRPLPPRPNQCRLDEGLCLSDSWSQSKRPLRRNRTRDFLDVPSERVVFHHLPRQQEVSKGEKLDDYVDSVELAKKKSKVPRLIITEKNPIEQRQDQSRPRHLSNDNSIRPSADDHGEENSRRRLGWSALRNLPLIQQRQDGSLSRKPSSGGSFSNRRIVDYMDFQKNERGRPSPPRTSHNKPIRPRRSEEEILYRKCDSGGSGSNYSFRRGSFSGRSWMDIVDSEDVDNEENPQLLVAQPSDGLPNGYLRRKDGVILSVGSSTCSRVRRDRRIDDHKIAQIGAENVVASLRSKGIKVHDINGIMGSNSASDDGMEEERYRVDDLSTSEAAEKLPSVGSSLDIIEIKTDEGVDGGSKISDFSQDSILEREALRLRQSNSNHSDRTQSFNQVEARREINDRGRRVALKTPCGTTNKNRLLKQAEPSTPKKTIHDHIATFMKRQGSKEPNGKESQIVQDEAGDYIIEEAIPVETKSSNFHLNSSVKANVNVKNPAAVKKVGFYGEFPPVTRDGDRVPEVVRGTPDPVLMAFSDITSVQNTACTTLSSVTFQGAEGDLSQMATPRMSGLFERLCVTCSPTTL